MLAKQVSLKLSVQKQPKMTKQKAKTMSYVSMLRAMLTRRDKIILLFLFIATVFFSVMETISISIVMPYITFASNPDLILSQDISKRIYELLECSSSTQFMIFFSVILIAFYLFRIVYGVAYNYALNRFAFRKYHFFAYRLFCKAVDLNYADFTRKKTDTIRQRHYRFCA